MAKEIERKWLIRPDQIVNRSYKSSQTIEQGYFHQFGVRPTFRVRRTTSQRFITAYLTMKGRDDDEFEYAIPLEDATQMLEGYCENRVLVKTRLRIKHGDFTIELDIFKGRLSGLILAEVEFPTKEEASAFFAPDWFGEDVSDMPVFRNASLACYGLPDYNGRTGYYALERDHNFQS